MQAQLPAAGATQAICACTSVMCYFMTPDNNMVKTIIFAFFLLVASYGKNGFAQSTDSLTTIVDPIETSCYQIFPDNPIKHYDKDSEYVGKIIFTAKVNEVTLSLTDFKIVFASLHSRHNLKDTIEFRPNYTTGNQNYLNKISPKLVEHLNYIKLRKVILDNCSQTERFYLPLIID